MVWTWARADSSARFRRCVRQWYFSFNNNIAILTTSCPFLDGVCVGKIWRVSCWWPFFFLSFFPLLLSSRANPYIFSQYSFNFFSFRFGLYFFYCYFLNFRLSMELKFSFNLIFWFFSFQIWSLFFWFWFVLIILLIQLSFKLHHSIFYIILLIG